MRVKDRECWSCEAVCEYIIRAACEEKNTYYVGLLSKRDGNAVRAADFDNGTFVSHARKSLFVDLIDALNNYFENQAELDREDMYIWLDMFCCNQPELLKEHVSPEVTNFSMHLIKKGIHVAISKFSHRVIFFDSWNNPSALTRAWCAWELLGVAVSEKSLGVALTPREEDKFLKALCGTTEENGMISQSLSAIDIARAQCFKEEDRMMIMQTIEEQSSIRDVNETIIGCLWKFYVATARKELKSRRGNDNGKSQQYLALLNSLALLLTDQVCYFSLIPLKV